MAPRLAFLLLATAATAAACGGPDDHDAPIDAQRPIDAAPPVGDTCGNAERITLPGGVGTTTMSGSTTSYRDDYSGDCADDTPDRLYVVSVPAGHRLIVTLDAASTSVQTTLGLVKGVDACGVYPFECDVRGWAPGLKNNDAQAVFENTRATDVDIYVLIEMGAEGDSNAYGLEVSVDLIPPTPAGDTCELAEAVTLVGGAATVSGTLSFRPGYKNDYDSYPAPCGAAGAGGLDRVYRVSVPPRQRLEGTLTPTSNLNVALFFVGGPPATCDDVCLGSAFSGINAVTAFVRYDNASDASQDVFVVVDGGYHLWFDSDFRLDLRAFATPPGETCATAEPIDVSSGSATVSGTTLGYDGNLAPSCPGFVTTGPDHFFSLSIPAHQTATVTMMPNGIYDLGVYLVAGPPSNCTASAACLASDNSHPAGAADRVTYTNPGNAPLDVLVGVDAPAPYYGPFTISVTVN